MSRVSTGSLGCSLTSVGKPAPPRPTRPPLTHGGEEAGLIGHFRCLDSRVYGLLAIGLDDNRVAHPAIGETEGFHSGHGARNTGVDICRDKTACLTDLGANKHFVALFDQAFAGAPMCWLMRMRTCAGRGIGIGLLAAVALSCGVCAPSAARFSLFNMEFKSPILLELPPPRPCRRTGTGAAAA